MQPRLRFYLSALVALHCVFVWTANCQCARGAEGSWDPFASQPATTLGAGVVPQEFDLSASTIDILQRQAVQKLPRLVPAQPNVSPAQPDSKTQKNGSKSEASPFAKWISPKAISSPDSKSTGSKSTASESKPVEVSDDQQGVPPRLARRIQSRQSHTRGTSSQTSKNARSRSSQSTAKSRSRERARAKPKPAPIANFPTPVAALTVDSDKVDPSELPPLTSSQVKLRNKIRNVLKHYYSRPLNTRDRSPWEMMHSLLAYEVDSKVLRGGPRGEAVSAIGWLCFNQPCKRRTLMYVNDEGEMQVRVGPALQGHRGQLLAMLAQAKVTKDYPMNIEGHEFTIADLVKMEMGTCYPRTELTFKLIGLMHFLNSDTTWMNEEGMEWNIPRLVSEEMRQPVRGAACGGTHRLSGLTLAYKTRQARGEPIDGEYLKAQRFIVRYQQYAYRLQNRDGSFSTEWFRGSGNENDLDRKLKTTGHLLEWLLYAATEKELQNWKTTKAANFLANIMYNNRYKDWEAGPLGHAIHALLLYDRLVFSAYDQLDTLPVAGKPKRTTQTRSRR